MSTFLQKEMFVVGGSKMELSNQLVRTDAVDIINQMRMTVPGTLATLEGGDSDYINASPGTHGFPELNGTWTHLSSIAAGTISDKQLVVSDSAIIEGVHFRGEANPPLIVTGDALM